MHKLCQWCAQYIVPRGSVFSTYISAVDPVWAVANQNASSIVNITASFEYYTGCSIREMTALLEHFDIDTKRESIIICFDFLVGSQPDFS